MKSLEVILLRLSLRGKDILYRRSVIERHFVGKHLDEIAQEIYTNKLTAKERVVDDDNRGRDFVARDVGHRRAASMEVVKETCPGCGRERELIRSSKHPELRVCNGCLKRLSILLKKGKLSLEASSQMIIAVLWEDYQERYVSKEENVKKECAVCQKPALSVINDNTGKSAHLCRRCLIILSCGVHKGEVNKEASVNDKVIFIEGRTGKQIPESYLAKENRFQATAS